MRGIRQVSVDHANGISTIVMNDGTLVSERHEPTRGAKHVTRSTYLPGEERVEVTCSGSRFSVRVWTGAPERDRPVVYLDQNHWIYLARWMNNRDSVGAEDAEFYRLLASEVEHNRIVVPESAAHMQETAKRPGQSRLEVASAMVRLSQGWQFRNVLPLQRAEIRTMFGASGPVTRSLAVTLEPGVILDKTGPDDTLDDLPEEFQALHERTVWATVFVSVLLAEASISAPANDLARAWAQSFKPLAEALNGNGRAKARARDVTRLRFVGDIGRQLAGVASEAGLSPEAFGAWLENDCEVALSRVPGLARLREVLHLRLWNATERWEGNDLNDWLYLSYAGAYTDLVVGERKMINYLRRVDSRVPAGARLQFKAAAALKDLQRLVARVE